MSHSFIDYPSSGPDQGIVKDIAPAADSGSVADAITGSMKRLYDRIAANERQRPLMPAYQFRAGRTWFTRFNNSARDALEFDISNYTYATDGALNVIVPSSPNSTPSFVRLRERVQDAVVKVKWRLDVANNNWTPALEARRLSDDVRLTCYHNFPGGILNVGNTAVANTTDTTRYRYTAFRVVGDVLQVKHWFADEASPDWQFTGRLEQNDSNDNLETGIWGFFSQYGDCKVAEFSVTELVREDDNLIHNADLSIADSATGLPLFWKKDQAGDGATMSVVDVTDRFGQTRKALRIAKTTTNTGTAPSWRVDTYNPDAFGRWVWGQNGNGRFEPAARLPRWVEVSCWTRGENVFNTVTGSFGALFNNRYASATNTGEWYSFGAAFYNQDLGPYCRSSVGAEAGDPPASQRGKGTWDWTLTRWRMEIVKAADVLWVPWLIGFHDNTCTGTLEIMDPYARAIA